MAENESRPERRNPQTFTLSVDIFVDSDSGKVTERDVHDWLEGPLRRLLNEDLLDAFDRDPGNPAPFSLHGAGHYRLLEVNTK